MSPRRGQYGAYGSRQHVCDPGCRVVLRMYAEGESAERCGIAVGHVASWVLKRVREHGVAVRPRARTAGLRVEWAQDACDRYASGQTLQQIGQRLGLTRERIRQVLRKCGVRMRKQRGRVHVCGPACAVVQGAVQPVRLQVLSAQSGLTHTQLQYASRVHGVRTVGRGHQCGPRCAVLRDALAAGHSMRRAAQAAGMQEEYVSQRFPAYHPDWNWTRKRAELRPLDSWARAAVAARTEPK